MDKKELIQTIAERISITKTSKSQIKAVLESLTKLIHSQHEVMLRGVGKFKWKTKAARMARNPKTGEKIEVPEKTVLTFRASK